MGENENVFLRWGTHAQVLNTKNINSFTEIFIFHITTKANNENNYLGLYFLFLKKNEVN